MGVLSTYDNSQHADLRDEIAAAKSNPLVPSRRLALARVAAAPARPAEEA